MPFFLTSNPFSLGQIIATPGTPQSVLNNFPAAKGTKTPINMIAFQSHPNNSGNCYVGSASMNKVNLSGVLRVLQPGDSWSVGDNMAGNIINLDTLYVDADNPSSGILAVAYTK